MSSAGKQSFIRKLVQLFKTVKKPPPADKGDQKYASEETPDDLKSGIIKELVVQQHSIPEDIDILVEIIKVAQAGGYKFDIKQVPDMVYQLGKLIASLPPSGWTQANLIAPLAKLGWDSLGHPPIAYLGDEWQYRSADGSYNNIRYPHIGKSNTVYAKSVKSTHLHTAAMPDPGTVFDALVARKQYKPHPNKISSLMFYLVVIIIHDLFRTSHDDPNMSLTTSYLDLSPLYGSNQDEQNLVRTFQDGKLKPDCFSEDRLGAFPPGVAALLLCFNRFHNYAVGQLATINENGKFSMPDRAKLERMTRAAKPSFTDDQVKTAVDAAYTAALTKRDNDLFQTARLVTCGLYINIVLNDYVGTLVGIPELNTAWFLNPYVGGGTEPLAGQATPIATGNQVSCEFNLVYRFHMIISERDDKWTQGLFAKLFPGKDPATISLDDFRAVLAGYLATIDPDPSKRNVAGLTRKADGTFDDAELIQIITDSTEDMAAAFDSGIPKIMRVIEMLGIYQSRYWKTATFNEFRAFFGLPKYTKFEDMTSDPEKVDALRHFYGHPDNLELYPGIVIEDVPSPSPGWLPPVTLARAIFSDGITLLRGDRFYTQDYSPNLLTQWGYSTVTSNPNLAGGAVMYLLLMRSFPGWYKFNSIYAMFPFSHPDKTREVQTKLKQIDQFSFDKPSPPAKPMDFVSTYDACIKVLDDRTNFHMPWGAAIKALTGQEYMLSGDSKENTNMHKTLHAEIMDVKGAEKAMWEFYVESTNTFLKRTSFKIGNYYEVDAVADVGNIVFANFFGKMFNFPLKTDETPRGLITEWELFEAIGAIFTFLFFNGDEGSGLKLKNGTLQAYDQLSQLVKLNVTAINALGELDKAIYDLENKSGILRLHGDNLIRRMLKDGYSIDSVVTQILLTSTGMINLSPQFAQIIDLYLSPQYADEWNAIQILAQSDDTDSLTKLTRYVMEAMRISSSAAGVERIAANNVVVQDGANKVSCTAGDQVFIDLDNANKDPSAFPDPLKVKLDRPFDKYIYFGWGVHSCVGSEMSTIGLTAMLKCFARLKNLRRSPGDQGTLKYTIMGPVRVYMQEDWSNYSPWPTTFKLLYDA